MFPFKTVVTNNELIFLKLGNYYIPQFIWSISLKSFYIYFGNNTSPKIPYFNGLFIQSSGTKVNTDKLLDFLGQSYWYFENDYFMFWYSVESRMKLKFTNQKWRQNHILLLKDYRSFCKFINHLTKTRHEGDSGNKLPFVRSKPFI